MSDLISRQAAIEAFMAATSDGDKYDWCKWVLTQVPSAEPLAHWIYINAGSHHRWSYRCSNCSRLSGYPSEYCPFCGFNMNEEWRE